MTLTSATTLGKINNFVHRDGKNKVSLSHAEVPTVTNVRVAQRFDDSSDLQARYLAETEPIPAPPPVPPAPVPGPAPVPNVPAV